MPQLPVLGLTGCVAESWKVAETMIVRIFLLAAAGVSFVGCAPMSGVVTGAADTEAGSVAPDVQFVSVDGEQASFNQVRHPVSIVAFSAPEGAGCCWLDPNVVQMADEVWDLPVTVAQFSIPKGECPHGQNCVEACNLNKGGLMSLCDAKRIAWEAYGRPAPGALLLLDTDSKVLMTASIGDSDALVHRAKKLGQAEQERRDSRERPELR